MTFKIEYLPIAEATTPKDGHVIYADRWWVVNPEGTAITFARLSARYRSPQCNHDRRVTDQLIGVWYPDHIPKLIPCVYLPPQHDE